MSDARIQPAAFSRYDRLFENESFVIGDYHCRQHEKSRKTETVCRDELVFVRKGFFMARFPDQEVPDEAFRTTRSPGLRLFDAFVSRPMERSRAV